MNDTYHILIKDNKTGETKYENNTKALLLFAEEGEAGMRSLRAWRGFDSFDLAELILAAEQTIEEEYNEKPMLREIADLLKKQEAAES